VLAEIVTNTGGEPTNTLDSVIYVLTFLLLLMGGGGVVAGVKYLRNSGVRDRDINKTVAEVLGDHTQDLKPLRTEVMELRTEILAVRKSISPNGLNSDELGDMVKRTENGVKRMDQTLNRHIGASEEAHTAIWRAIRLKADK
jgi:hypothetical protein